MMTFRLLYRGLHQSIRTQMNCCLFCFPAFYHRLLHPDGSGQARIWWMERVCWDQLDSVRGSGIRGGDAHSWSICA